MATTHVFIINDDDSAIYEGTVNGHHYRKGAVVYYVDRFGRQRWGYRGEFGVFDSRADAEAARAAVDEALDL